MSLRILAQGLAAPVYGQVFSFGLSHEIKKALGILLPGLPLFLSAAFSASGMTVSGVKKLYVSAYRGMWMTLRFDPLL